MYQLEFKSLTLILIAAISSFCLYANDLTSETNVNNKKSHFIGLGLQIHEPVSTTRIGFARSIPGVRLDYEFLREEKWSLGLGFSNRNLKFKNSSSSLSLLVLSQNIFRLYRIYYPFFLKLGFEWSYLMPMAYDKGSFDVESHLESEIGVGFGIGGMYMIGESSYIAIQFLRYRGSKSYKLHAMEMCLKFGIPLY